MGTGRLADMASVPVAPLLFGCARTRRLSEDVAAQLESWALKAASHTGDV
jgi:hypothetical protein